MKLGLYQTHSPAGDLAAALRELRGALAAAAAQGVDILTLPEVFLPGYGAARPVAPDGFEKAMAAIPDIVAAHGVGLVIGAAEYDETGARNAACAYGRDGALLAAYRKIQLWGEAEAAVYRPGDTLTTFDFEGRKLGLLICYDVEFPEHVRALARAGAEAILVPTANMQPFVNVNEITVPARALESGLTIVYANYCGEEGDLTYTARSLIAGPDGRPLAALGKGPGLIAADLPTREESVLETPFSTQFDDLRAISTIRNGLES